MKLDILRDLTVEELRDKEKNMRKELFNLRFQSAVGHIENPNRFKEVRREIAQMLTIIRLKQNEAS